MQFSKSSKKTTKNAPEAATENAAGTKARSKSSKPKKMQAPESALAVHHRAEAIEASVQEVPSRSRYAPSAKSLIIDPVGVVAPPPVLPDIPARQVSQQAVAELAHEYWRERGCSMGSAEEDWLRAERELRGMAKS